MIFFIRKHTRKVSLLLILLTVFLALTGFTQEAGECEKALARCMFNSMGHLLNFPRFFNEIAYCALGYAFCLKYLDK
ncbi:MAG: hypothetical protein JSV96_04920 [Candidatus Aminicenantes bacterium]|nr:MAG: hypothetical protein JSV96_04920 [Candidatus Aminicenantes bacterium]